MRIANTAFLAAGIELPDHQAAIDEFGLEPLLHPLDHGTVGFAIEGREGHDESAQHGIYAGTLTPCDEFAAHLIHDARNAFLGIGASRAIGNAYTAACHAAAREGADGTGAAQIGIAADKAARYEAGHAGNRVMAGAVGINTEKVDRHTFALGCGIAGIAGSAFTMIGSTGPTAGQQYIVDTFLVVVFGGAGSLLGTIASAFSISQAQSIMEFFLSGSMAKVLTLLTVVGILMLRPQGLFALKLRK